MGVNHIDQLAYELEGAKQAEATARQARLEAEAALIDAVGLKEEGSQTLKTDWYKISTTQSLTRKISDIDNMPANIKEKITKAKYEIDTRQLKQLPPDEYAQAVQFIITTPAKPAVKVERIQQTNDQ